MRDLLRQKVVDSLALSPPPLTRRDVHLPAVRGKALAVIGMRRTVRQPFSGSVSGSDSKRVRLGNRFFT